MGYLEIFQIIAEKVKDIDVKDDHNNTPLHMAAESGFSDLCKFILSKTDNPFPVNDEKKTPYDYAKKNGHTATEKLIGI